MAIKDNAYPDVDTDSSGYVSAVRFTAGNWPDMVMPGWHRDFEGAAKRARAFAAALRKLGETSLYAYVDCRKNAPRDFPQGGVRVEP